MSGGPSRRAVVAGLGTLAAACSPLETFDTLVRVDKGWVKAAEAVRYGADPRQSFDVYRPERPGRAPLLVWFYGGSWNSGSKEEYAFIAKVFAARGYVCVLPDYRLAPRHPFPAFVEDAAAAVSAARQQADTWLGDADQTVIAGHSAGAYIAVMLGADPRYLAAAGMSRTALRAIAAVAGPYDFHPFPNRAMQQAFGPFPEPRRTQPVAVADAGMPPTLLITGTEDTVVPPRHSAALARRLHDVGARVEVVAYPGVGHIEIMTAITPTFRKRAPTLRDIDAFFRQAGVQPL